jgi:hypothetical protein
MALKRPPKKQEYTVLFIDGKNSTKNQSGKAKERAVGGPKHVGPPWSSIKGDVKKNICPSS